MSASLRTFVCKALERNRISFGDLRRLQRTVLPHGLLTREQAEVLIALDQTIPRTRLGPATSSPPSPTSWSGAPAPPAGSSPRQLHGWWRASPADGQLGPPG
jgi:hypothetical protein